MENNKNKKLEEIKIEITNKCNKDCYFCFSTKTLEKQDMDFDTIISILDQAKEIEALGVRITGGEPLLHKDIKHILQECRKRNLYTIVNTNGELFTENNIDILNNVDEILVSVHSTEEFENKKEIINRIKQSFTYQTRGGGPGVMEGGPNLVIKACTIMTKQNIAQLEEFYNFFEQNKINQWFLLRPVSTDKEIGLDKEHAIKLINKIIQLNKKHKTQTFIANAVPFCILDENNSTENRSKMINICIGGRNDNANTKIVVDVNGNIKPDYHSETVFGNINNNTIKQIWNSEQLMNYNTINIPDKCKQCDYFAKCKAGILLNEKQEIDGRKIRFDPLMKND